LSPYFEGGFIVMRHSHASLIAHEAQVLEQSTPRNRNERVGSNPAVCIRVWYSPTGHWVQLIQVGSSWLPTFYNHRG